MATYFSASKDNPYAEMSQVADLEYGAPIARMQSA